MRARRVFLVLVMLLPATATAEDHDKEVSTAFAVAGGGVLPGGHLAVAWGPWHSGLTIPGEFSYQAGESDGAFEKKVSLSIGLRYTRPLAGEHGAKGHTTVFAHVLVGRAWIRDERPAEERDDLPEEEEGWHLSLGGGLEYFVEKPTGLRLQVDYVGLFGLEHKFPRLSIGLFHQFGKES